MASMQKKKENNKDMPAASNKAKKVTKLNTMSKKKNNKASRKASKGSIELQVINIVQNADKLMGVQAIRLALVQLGRTDGAALKKRLKEVLDKLIQQKRSDFAKIKESYYAGADSQVK